MSVQLAIVKLKNYFYYCFYCSEIRSMLVASSNKVIVITVTSFYQLLLYFTINLASKFHTIGGIWREFPATLHCKLCLYRLRMRIPRNKCSICLMEPIR